MKNFSDLMASLALVKSFSTMESLGRSKSSYETQMYMQSLFDNNEMTE